MSYSISDDRTKLDLDVIHGFLTRSYWAKGIPREIVDRSIKHSLCAGIYDRNGKQVAFARVITDQATFAYLCDVFVLEGHRSKGLGKMLVRYITAHPALQGLRRMMLLTSDAHGLYEQFGFTPITDPEKYLCIVKPDIYQNGSM